MNYETTMQQLINADDKEKWLSVIKAWAALLHNEKPDQNAIDMEKINYRVLRDITSELFINHGMGDSLEDLCNESKYLDEPYTMWRKGRGFTQELIAIEDLANSIETTKRKRTSSDPRATKWLRVGDDQQTRITY